MSQAHRARRRITPLAELWGPNDYNETRLRIRIEKAASANDAARIADIIEITSSPECTVTAEALRSDALISTLSHDSLTVMEYLLTHGLDARQVQPQRFSRRMAEILLQHGWDINCRSATKHPRSARVPLLWIYVAHNDYKMIQWCLGHGSEVISDDIPPAVSHRACSCVYCYEASPVLNVAAKRSTVEIFNQLHALGAHIPENTLHKAVEACCADVMAVPSLVSVKDESGGEERKEAASSRSELATRQAMVRHLVEDLGLDVDAFYQPEREHMFDRAGTPFTYVARHASENRDYAWVIRYLIDQGASLARADLVKSAEDGSRKD